MRTLIFTFALITLVAILFFSLFRQPVNRNTSRIRAQMRTEELLARQSSFVERHVQKCIADLYQEAEKYIDSLISSTNISPVNELDTLLKPQRPDVYYSRESGLERMTLEPLFEKLDSLERN